jgi:hypothetical protein
MLRTIQLPLIALLGLAAGVSAQQSGAPPTVPPARPAGSGMYELAPPLFEFEEGQLRMPLAAGDKAYGAIDGRQLKVAVDDVTGFARDYKAAGHQYWGRIPGTTADAETAAYVEKKFRAFGLEDVKTQPFDLPAQWFPTSWEISATRGAQSVPLTATFPMAGAPATDAAGLDLEIVWGGSGTAADLQGRDVRGKAVLLASTPLPSVFFQTVSMTGGIQRVHDAGAAAILVSLGIPGNVASQMSARGALTVPAFTIGQDDGNRIRELLEKSDPGPARLRLRLATERRSGLKSSAVWGTLRGDTDENILIIAHTDSYFEGAVDNATGVATMLALAEYFAKAPKSARRRTLTFVATAAHHAGSPTTRWIHDNMQPFLAKTALIINCEHTAMTQLYLWGSPPVLRKSTISEPRMFALTGSAALQQTLIGAMRAFGVGTLAQPERNFPGDSSAISRDAPEIQILGIPITYHTDIDQPGMVPASGLEAVARAYAKAIDGINTRALSELRERSSNDNAKH